MSDGMHVYVTLIPGREKVPREPHQRVGTRNKEIKEILQVELMDCLD